MYHRIGEAGTDPWGLCVAPQRLAAHLEVLASRYRVIQLDEVAGGLLSGRLPRRWVVVTFDDGYADNLYQATPLIDRLGVPATFFLTAAQLGSDQEFWWDELDRLLLQPGRLPERLELEVGGERRAWTLDADATYTAAEFERRRQWRTWDASPGRRQTLYATLWELCYSLPFAEKTRLIETVRQWSGAGPGCRPTHRTLSREEVIRLARSGVASIGAHTMTHPALTLLPRDMQHREIAESKHELERLLGRPVVDFTYPHGRGSADTASLVRDAGFRSACTTVPGTVVSRSDLYRVPRVQVLDWDPHEFAGRMEAWFRDGDDA